MTTNFPLPELSSFMLDDDMIEQALRTPIPKGVRCCEIAIQPDSEDDPKYANRLLVAGLHYWDQNGDIPTARLVKNLLLMFFTGKLTGSRTVIERPQKEPTIMMSDEASDELSLDDLSIDLSAPLPKGGYDFSGVSNKR